MTVLRGGRGPRAAVVLLLFAGLLVLSPPQTSPVAAGPISGRVVDPAMAFDAANSRWVSLSSGESLSSPGATICTPVDPVVQARGWLNVPFRTGPTPDRLRGCLEGDALRDPPSGWWAAHEAGSVRAPTLLRLNNVWWLMYSARKAGSQQRCIGLAASDRPTGPWFHGTGALVCPADGTSADFPELHYDRAGQKLYLLWTQTVLASGRACGSQIKAQQFDTAAGALVGSATTVLDASEPVIGFDEIADAACPGGVRHVVENPSMVRGDNGTLWLFFSANARDTVNYATGWALCGAGAPGSQVCSVVNGLDPVQPARYRPHWGERTRTAPVGGVDARPYSAFPNGQGLGGLSVSVADPTVASATYVAMHLYWSGDIHIQLAFQLDTSQLTPALYETEVVALHGTEGTFGTVATTPPAGTTPSGHSVATRAVDSFGPAPGYEAIFNAMAANGTAFVSQSDQNRYFPTPTNDGMAVGAYDPSAGTWTNVPIRWNRLSNKNTVGTTTLPAVHPDAYAQELPWESASPAGAPVADDIRHVGASLGDVQAIDGGRAIAFVAPAGYPYAYGWLNAAGLPRPAGADGVWPAFGIVTQVNGKWQVASGSGWVNQWTGGQLATSVPRDPARPDQPSVSERACPTGTQLTFGADLALPADESWCHHLNELDEFPDSQDVIVAGYGGGLTALRVRPAGGGRYTTTVRGFYKFEPFPTPSTTDEPDDMIVPAAKTVDTDPSGVAGDERFVVQFDLFLETDGDPQTFDGGYGPGVVIEFSYDEATGDLVPVSAPLLAPPPRPGAPIGGLGGLYDSDGNFWAQGHTELAPFQYAGFLGVYAKTNGQRDLAACGFDPAIPLTEYFTDDPVTGRRLWGEVCAPDYDIVQARPFTERWGGTLMLTEDPATKTMVAHDYWYSGAIAVRRSGTAPNLSFEVGNLVDTGETRLGNGVEENRPGVFDTSGRYWFVSPGATPGPRTCNYAFPSPFTPLCPGKPAGTAQPHWMQSVDVAQLFAPPPIPLAAASGTATRVEAEHTATIGTTPGAPVDGVVPVRSTAAMRRNSGSAENNGDAGFELVGGSSGTVEYKLWVPVAGSYRLNYRVRGSGSLQVAVAGSGTSYPATPVTNPNPASPSSATTTGPTLNLPAGLQTIRLSATSGSTWILNWFDVTRV